MHIVIVNPYDPLPWESKRRGRYSMLSAELASRGHQVTWLTADFRHVSKSYRSWPDKRDAERIRVIPIHVSPYSKNVDFRRIISQRQYALGVKRQLVALSEEAKIDVVVSSIPPTESASVAMSFCSAVGAVGVLDMQDAWPMVFETLFPMCLRRLFGFLFLWPFRDNVKRAVKYAQGLVAVSPEFLHYLGSFDAGESHLCESVFPLGFDVQQIPTRAQFVKSDHSDISLLVSYIGNFSYFYDLETVVRAAGICEQKDIHFVLIGHGPTYKAVTSLVRRLDLKNISFHGYVPFDRALPILAQSDVGLMPYIDDWPSNMPNKAFDYLFLGIPIVSSVKGLFQEILEKEKFGLQYQAGNARSLADVLMEIKNNRQILSKMRRRGLAYARANMDGQVIYRQYAGFIEKLAAERGVCCSDPDLV